MTIDRDQTGDTHDTPRRRIVPPFVVLDTLGTTPAAPLMLGCEALTPHHVRAIYVARSLHFAILAAPPWELPDAITAQLWNAPPLGNGKGSREVLTLERLTAATWATIRERLAEAEAKAARGEIAPSIWEPIAARFRYLDSLVCELEQNL